MPKMIKQLKINGWKKMTIQIHVSTFGYAQCRERVRDKLTYLEGNINQGVRQGVPMAQRLRLERKHQEHAFS